MLFVNNPQEALRYRWRWHGNNADLDDDDDGVLDAADAFPLISVLGLLTPMVMVSQMSATRTASISD